MNLIQHDVMPSKSSFGRRTSGRRENSSDDQKAKSPRVRDRNCTLIAEHARYDFGRSIAQRALKNRRGNGPSEGVVDEHADFSLLERLSRQAVP
jgi:hypothetical protein